MSTAVVQGHNVSTEASSNWWWEYASSKAPDRNELYYLKFTLLSVAWFLALHMIIHLVAMRKTSIYRDMNTPKRTEYRTYIVSSIHSIVAVFLSTLAMFFICGDGKTVFNNNECMNTVRYIHIWALLHTCGNFIVDFFFLYFVVKGDSTLDY